MKKKMKRLCALLLVAAMLVFTLSACGGDTGNKGSSGTSAGGDSSKSESKTESKTEDSQDGGEKEIVKLKLWGFTNAAPNSDQINAVAAAASEITREKLGVEIEMIRNFDAEKANLAMMSGEEWDLFNIHGFTGGIQALATNRYASPLNDLIAEYGKDILELQPDSVRAGSTVDGVLYAIPNNADTARAAGFAMNKSVLDELGIDAASIKTWDDVHDVLVKVKEGRPDLYPLVPSWANGGMQEVIPYHQLVKGVGLEDVFTDSTEIINIYASDAYREFCERMYQWNKEGLIMPDSTTTTDNMLMQTVGFADYENIKPGKEIEIKKSWGFEAVLIELTPPYMTNAFGGWCIPESSKNKELAMQLLNLMWTDPELSNIFINGVEGTHWEWKDDSKTSIVAPEGIDVTGSSGYESLDWAWPNCRITAVWDGGDPEQWTKLQEFCDSARVSPANGFTFDTSSVMNETTACGNVITKYNVGLRWGELDPDETIPTFVAELEAAGINTIIEECQAQFDAYLASK